MGIRFNARTNSIETDAASVDFTQPITTPASTASLAGLNIAEGVAPSAPVDGDVWVTAGGNFNARLNGVTVDLAAGGGGDVTKVGTPVNNQIGVWTGDGTIEGDANLVWDGTAHELTLSDGTDSILMQIVLNTFDIGGSGLNSIRLQPTNGQNSVVANAGGSVVLSYNNTPTFQTNINRSESLNAITSNSGGVERVLTVGDIEAGQPRLRYFFDATTTSGDPGSGQIRYNNATPASVTSLYINDTSDSGLNSDRVLNNLASGDILTLCDEQDGADYLVVSVNGAPTDNTGWWTIPVTVIHSGTLPTNVVNIDVQWFSQAGGGGNVSNTGTPVNNQLAIWTDATTIEGDAKVTFDGSSFAAYGDGTATDLHYLGLDSTNRFRFECGTNYGMILYEDDNVSTEDQFFYIGNDSLSTGNQNILFRDGGSDWYHAEYYGTTARYRHTGPIEILGTTDHVGTGGLGTGIDSNYIQLWGKSLTLDHEPMITCGDLDIDHTVANIIETCYHFDQTTTAADPGAGNLRWNNATPGSVTNWYVDDLESTGKDASFVLSNLSNGDVITLRSQWDDADYMVASVNGTPTDNTGYWTIPVTVIHAGGRPATGDPVHLLVDWVNPLQNNVYARKSTGTQTVSSTTFTTATNYSGISLDAGVYLCSGQFRVNRNNTSNNVQIRWTSSTYRTSSPSTDMDSSRTRVFFTYLDSGGTTQFVQMVGDATSAAALNLSTNTSTSWVQVEGVFTVNSATTLDWEIRTSNVATSIRMEDGGVIKFTKISGSTTTTSGTYLS